MLFHQQHYHEHNADGSKTQRYHTAYDHRTQSRGRRFVLRGGVGHNMIRIFRHASHAETGVILMAGGRNISARLYYVVTIVADQIAGITGYGATRIAGVF